MEPFYLKKVFVWVPEYMWDNIGHIPCPHCGGRAQPDGWNTEALRVFLEEDVCFLIGFRCADVTTVTCCVTVCGWSPLIVMAYLVPGTWYEVVLHNQP